MNDKQQLDAALVAGLAGHAAEPAWFTELRQQALAAYSRLDVPAWDRTPATAFFGDRWEPHAVQERSCATGVAQGVIVADLWEAAAQYPDLVRAHLGNVVRPEENKLLGRHYAAINSGVLVYVPRDVEVNTPIQISSVANAQGAGFEHIIVIVEQGAQVTIVDDAEAGEALANGSRVVEMVGGNGSRIQYASLQTLGAKDTSFTMRRCVLGRDAQVEWIIGVFGSSLTRDLTETVLEGDGSQASGLAVYFGAERQHLDIGVTMRHKGLHTSSDILAKGALNDQGRGIFRAMTEIAPGARYTSAYQRANSLLLSGEARADAIPALEIDEDEVQAGHAATVSQVDDEQLYYLMSRGLPQADATRMIVNGFFDPVLQRIPHEPTKERLWHFIDRKMNS